MQPIKHILVIRLSAMGDVAMTVPVIRALLLQHPTVRITVVSRPFFKPFFDGIDRVNFFSVDLNKKHKSFIGLLRLYNELRLLQIDAVADLHNVLRSKIIRTFFLVTGKKVSFVDKGRKEKKALTRAKNKIFVPLKSMIERHCDVFKKLGFSINMNQPTFPPKADLSKNSISITNKKNENWIGIAPFAQYESKVYPLNLMQKVIDELANSENKLFLFGGGKKEIEELNKLKANYQNVIVIAGKVKLDEELKIISNLDVMLSMDSGNAHIAAMLGIDVITIWGSTHPYAGFKPFNQPEENCVVPDRNLFPLLPTSAYGKTMLKGYENVMNTLSPLLIVDKIKKRLSSYEKSL